jgi:acetyl-CoA/propionyl-CoA carboxylase biotin carboxyl carrier protein
MLAKIIAHGADRAEAFERLASALDQTVILGLTTNLRFLRWLVREPAVVGGHARIDTLERIWPPGDWDARTAIPRDAWQVAARRLAAPVPGAPAIGAHDPWAGGWRVTGAPRISLDAEGETRLVALETPPVGLEVVVASGAAHVDVGGQSVAFRVSPPPDVDRAARSAVAHAHGGGADVVAPMPGVIIAVHVNVGDVVESGQAIATLEAMKMEHTVLTSVAGTVTDVAARQGTQLARGDLLATIGP